MPSRSAACVPGRIVYTKRTMVSAPGAIGGTVTRRSYRPTVSTLPSRHRSVTSVYPRPKITAVLAVRSDLIEEREVRCQREPKHTVSRRRAIIPHVDLTDEIAPPDSGTNSSSVIRQIASLPCELDDRHAFLLHPSDLFERCRRRSYTPSRRSSR